MDTATPAATLDPRLKLLLHRLNLRQTASFTYKDLVLAMTACGWRVSKQKQWVTQYRPSEFLRRSILADFETGWTCTDEYAHGAVSGYSGRIFSSNRIKDSSCPQTRIIDSIYQRFLSLHGPLPATGKRGAYYVTRVGPIEPKGSLTSSLPFTIQTYQDTISASRGSHNLHCHDTRRIGPLLAEAYNYGLQEQAAAAASEERHIPGGIRTLDNTGTCAICYRNIKLVSNYQTSRKEMVHHGYRRPGYGAIEGDCFGVSYPPYELSPSACEAYLARALIPGLDRAKQVLQHLRSPNVPSLDRVASSPRSVDGRPPVPTIETIYPDHPHFPALLKFKQDEAKSEVRYLESEVTFFTNQVATWKLKPLPEPGTLVREGRP